MRRFFGMLKSHHISSDHYDRHSWHLSRATRSHVGAAIALLTSASLVLAGCGSASSQSADTSDDGKMMTVDVFDQIGNVGGLQKGWFAKIIKDKFKIRLNYITPNVSGGGDSLFDTRTAAGNLGDLIITNTGDGRLAKLVKAGLLTDMTPYMKNETYLKKFKSSAQQVEKLAGKKGIWGYGQDVSDRSPSEPAEIYAPKAAPYIMWNYYREIGYPRIKNLDDFVGVLKRMQDQARKDTGKNDIWALSLFKDWDGNAMANAQIMTNWYGFWQEGQVLAYGNGTQRQTSLDRKGIYQKTLRFLHKCEAAGIVDPDSSTQSWDQRTTKMNNEKILMTFWSWDGKLKVNSAENKAKGVGFELAPLEDQKDYVSGNLPNGNIGSIIAIGSKAKNKQRLVNFINWLYSPDGMYSSAAVSGTPCPKGLCWVMKNGQPALTDFGEKAFYNPAGLNVPASWGGGGFAEGQSGLNFQTVNYSDIDPSTHEPFDPRVWKSELAKKNPLDSDWSAHMGGAKTDMEYLEKHHEYVVQPGASYASPEEDSQISTVRNQINTAIIQHSWKAVVANSDAGFDSEISKMIDTANGLGFAKIQKIDDANIAAHVKACDEVVAQYKAKH